MRVGVEGEVAAGVDRLADEMVGRVAAFGARIDLDGDAVLDAVTERLRTRVATIMGYADNSAIDPTSPLTELGMDSLMAVRIRNTVRGDFGVEPCF